MLLKIENGTSWLVRFRVASARESRGYGVTGKATLLHEGRLRLLDWLMLLAVPALTLTLTLTLLAYLKA